MDDEAMKLPGNLPVEETVTAGSPHPGLSVFQLDNAHKYFNKEFILKEELEENLIEMYLENKNIYFAVEKIFNKQMSLKKHSLKSNNNTPVAEAKCIRSSRESKLTGEAISCLLTKHAQLLKRFRLDLSLAESDFDSSFCVSLSSITSTPSKYQEEPKDKSLCENGDESVYSTELLDQDCDVAADLISLFWLMSILPEPASSYCKQAMDRDQLAWKVSLYDVVLVLLNWGASLQSIGMEDALNMPSSLFSPPLLPPTSEMNDKNSGPVPANVALVLSSICERLPPASSPRMPCSHRALLVKVLVYAALDSAHRRYLAQYCHTIRSVLDSFHPWGTDEASMIVRLLQLDCVGLQNAVFVCCSIFNMTSSRLSLVGILASHSVLQQKFDLPSDPSFAELVRHLLYPPELLDKFKLWHVYIITSLLHSLLVRNASQTPPCSQEVITSLHQWTVDVRSALTQYPYTYSLDSSHVRERLSRLTSECATVMRTLYSTSVNKSLI